MAPKDEDELRHMIVTALRHDGPIAVRYPRGAGYGVSTEEPMRNLTIGEGEVLRNGSDVAIVAIGATVMPSLDAAAMLAKQDIQATVVNARFVKPLDERILADLGGRFRQIFTVEENAIAGGFGSAVMEALERLGITDVDVHRIGVPDRFIDHATQSQQRRELRLDATGIAEQVRAGILAAQRLSAGGA
jgi:1-deoxy-D-xylulose-5-phosphate synthase